VREGLNSREAPNLITYLVESILSRTIGPHGAEETIGIGGCGDPAITIQVRVSWFRDVDVYASARHANAGVAQISRFKFASPEEALAWAKTLPKDWPIWAPAMMEPHEYSREIYARPEIEADYVHMLGRPSVSVT